MDLTQRQADILRFVVQEHQQTGRPVGSRAIVESGAVRASSSTVRYELGRLQEIGLLETPHTSAGRVPTDRGYRIYIDFLVDPSDDSGLPVTVNAAAIDPVGQIDSALARTTQALAEATDLLAVVTAPHASGAVIRHIEVLQLQPTKLVVVIITSDGEVSRHVVPTNMAVDPGLVDWAAEYLNESVAGLTIGQNLVRQRLRVGDFGRAEQAMLALLEPAFIELVDDTQDVHVGGSSMLVRQLGSDVQRVVNLVSMLDERRRFLEALRPIVHNASGGLRGPALSSRVGVRIGGENSIPELRRLSVVGSSYGAGGRTLGMVGLIGPRAMDYPRAMHAVTIAADELSSIAEELYE